MSTAAAPTHTPAEKRPWGWLAVPLVVFAVVALTAGLLTRAADAGGDYFDNHGRLMGNIELGGGANGFANNAGATLYSGTVINLGDPTNVFTNHGLISPGAGQLAVEDWKSKMGATGDEVLKAYEEARKN